jgi:hypothetical protein
MGSRSSIYLFLHLKKGKPLRWGFPFLASMVVSESPSRVSKGQELSQKPLVWPEVTLTLS